MFDVVFGCLLNSSSKISSWLLNFSGTFTNEVMGMEQFDAFLLVSHVLFCFLLKTKTKKVSQ